MRPINQPGNHHGMACIFLQTRGGEKKCVAIIFCSPQRDEVEEAEFRRSRKSKRGKIAATLEQCVTSTFVILDMIDLGTNRGLFLKEGKIGN